MRPDNRLTSLIVVGLLIFSAVGLARGEELLDLNAYVSLALRQGDVALDLNDSLTTSDLDVSSAAHQFSPSLVPLANFGIASGNTSQTLGLEIQKSFETGTNMTLGYTGNRIENDDFVVSNSHNVRGYAQISQPLFRRWGQEYNRLGLTQAELQQKKRIFLARRTQQDIILGSIQKYYAAVLAHLQNAIAEKALARSVQYVEVAKSRQSVGLVSKTDVYRAELASLKAETAFLDQARSIELAIDILKENISRDSQWDITPSETIDPLVPVLPEDWQAILPQQRPEWQAQLIDLDLSGKVSFRAERDLLPDLSLNFLVEQRGQGASFDAAKHMEETSWSVQLQLNSTLDRFQEKTALTRAMMAEAKARRDSMALKRRIEREARQAFQDLLAEERRYAISQKSLVQAEKALDLAQIRYDRGLSDNVDLLDAEASFATAEMDIIQNQVAYNLSAVRLAHALGVLDLEWLRLSLLPEQDRLAMLQK